MCEREKDWTVCRLVSVYMCVCEREGLDRVKVGERVHVCVWAFMVAGSE